MPLQQSPEVQTIATRFMESFDSKKNVSLGDLLSREEGIVVIGTDPSEWFDDPALIERIMVGQATEIKQSGIRVELHTSRSYQEGTVGWSANQGHIVMPDGVTVQLRITLVAHREGNSWKIVHVHTSTGVPDTQALNNSGS